MIDNALRNNCLNFLTALVTAVRQISIYPAKHPIVANAIKSACTCLNLILIKKPALSMNLSPDNKILVEGEPLSDRGSAVADDFIPLFRKLDAEELTFNSGIADKEIDEFIKIVVSSAADIKKSGNINNLFLSRGIAHIKAKQFSYLKVEKGKEGIVLEGAGLDLEKLKSRLSEYCLKKIEKVEEVQAIEKDIFELIKSEFKEKNKLSATTKTVLKKYLLHSQEKQGTLAKLKNSLLEYGCPVGEVDELLNRFSDEIISPAPRKRKASGGVTDEVLIRENQELKSELGRLKQELDNGVSAVKDLEKKKASGGVTDEVLTRENQELKSKLSRIQQELDSGTLVVKELEKKNKRIADEKQRIDNIVHNLAEGMVVVDAQGKILLVNQAAESMLGITKGDIGRPIKEVVKDEHLLTLTKKIAPDQDGVSEKDIELISLDESTKKVLRTSQAVVEDHNGNTVGMVTMLNDITKQREIENLKSDFLANVSHELRTPLVAIEKSVSLILGKEAGELSATQAQFLSIAERNLKRLTLLINDLLDLSKLEARKMELKRETVVLEKIITDAVETLNNWARTKSIRIEKVIADNLAPVNADPNRIIQVLNNLIGNAIKFTPNNGTITVEASVLKEERAVKVAVVDTGAGIDKQDLVKIFDKFYQAKERAATDISGTGIGLAVVKEIVELHGGKVWAESEKGQGAKFIFTLPLNQ
jgi:PAS domain S-box-containing protein